MRLYVIVGMFGENWG